MSRPRPKNRAVIQVSKTLHDLLRQIKEQREEELERVVSFDEIIQGWRKDAEKASVA